MDTTAFATAWQREGYLEVETIQRMPNVSQGPTRPSPTPEA